MLFALTVQEDILNVYIVFPQGFFSSKSILPKWKLVKNVAITEKMQEQNIFGILRSNPNVIKALLHLQTKAEYFKCLKRGRWGRI